MPFIEQQIYASLDLPGVKAGHHTHASTPGLDPVSIERHEQICNRWGQYETGTEFQRALLHLPQWLDARPPAAPSHHLVILISHQGRDASGRPGALLRHIVRMDHATYLAWGAHPFRLLQEGALLQGWSPDTLFPEIGARSQQNSIRELQAVPADRLGVMRSLVQRFHAEGKLHLPTGADGPEVEATLGQFMCLLPAEQRSRLSVATFLYHNANDYALAAVRNENGGFEESLVAFAAETVSALPAAQERNVEELFGALRAQDWGRAAASLEAAAPAPASEDSVDVEDPMSASTVEISAASLEALAEADPLAEDDFRPSYRRRTTTVAQKGPSRRGRIATFGLVLLVAAAAVWWISGRDPSRTVSNDNGFDAASAPSLVELVEREEARLGKMLGDGARDFDIEEALRDGKTSFDRRLADTLRRERSALDEDLRRAAGATTDEDPVVSVAGALGAAADVTQEAARRVVTLDRLSVQADPAQLREYWDEENRTLVLAAADEATETAAAGPALAWAQGLVLAAEALGEWPTVAAGPLGAEEWGAYALRLERARDQFPSGVEAPSILSAADRAAAAVASLLRTVAGADLETVARRGGDAFSFLDGEAMRTAALDARATLGAMEQEGVALPPSLNGLRLWLEAGESVRESLSGRDASGALKTMAELCRDAEFLCETEPYVTCLDRWRLEAWVRVGSPDSGTGEELLEALGPAALPRGGQPALSRAVDVLRRVRAASRPAPPELVSEISGSVRGLGDTVARSQVDVWLAGQQRDAARVRAGFATTYGELRSALQGLRRASSNGVGGAFAAIREAMDSLDEAQLQQAVAQYPDQVAAVRALQAAWSRPVDFEWIGCEVDLLTDTDYAGTKQQVAQLEIVVSRAGGDALGRASASPSLYAPGAGFEKIVLRSGATLSLRADDRILVVGRDQRSSGWWWHLYADAPAGGHVLQSLARAREVRLSADSARRAMASPESPPSPDGAGNLVARVRLDFSDGWWRQFASRLPNLPE